jgi:hypothetical protein
MVQVPGQGAWRFPGRRFFGERDGLQEWEPTEVAILRQDALDPVLSADGSDLGVEGEGSARIARDGRGPEHRPGKRRRREQPHRRASQDRVDGLECLGNGRGRIENAPVCRDPHELPDTATTSPGDQSRRTRGPNLPAFAASRKLSKLRNV